MDIADYKRAKTELLCPTKCQGMAFTIYSDKTVKCVVCGRESNISELINLNVD